LLFVVDVRRIDSNQWLGTNLVRRSSRPRDYLLFHHDADGDARAARRCPKEKRMRSMTSLAGAVIFTIGLAGGTLMTARPDAQAFTVVMDCGAKSAAQVRTTLYFGLARPKGAVSELEWQIFLRDEVTKRFPAGLTVWEAEGQWRSAAGSIDHEQSKVLLLVHPDTTAARDSVQDLIGAYRSGFQQESVLWESARVCVAA
jgi:Protein of unknown function (DUF3574)